MRLISCRVENFGCLHGREYSFAPGASVLIERNGAGKSTLSEFIRAMFYGFPRANKDLNRNPRARFSPWQGGKFGGNLVFETESGTYRIERSFGKTPREDTFALYDEKTGLRSTRYSENIGEELFGLDSASFERSVYMPQSDSGGALSTDAIRAKLGGLVEDTNDINNFETATARLREARASRVPYRGQGGSVNRAQARLTELQRATEEAKEDAASAVREREALSEREAELESGRGKLALVRGQIAEAAELSAKAALFARYEEMTARSAGIKESLDALGAKYGNAVPTAAELDGIMPVYDEGVLLSARLRALEAESGSAPSPELTERFSADIPSEAETDECRELCRERAEKLGAAESLRFPPEDEAEIKTLEDFFAPGVPGEDFFDRCESDRREVSRLRDEAAGTPSGEDELALKKAGDAKTKSSYSFVVPVLLIILGLLIPSVRAAFIPVGIAGLIACAILYVIRNKNYREILSAVEKRKAHAEERSRQASELERALSERLSPYFPEGTDTGEALATLRHRADRLSSLSARRSAYSERKSAAYSEIAALDGKIAAFLSRWYENPAPEDFDALSSRLGAESREYRRALAHESERSRRIEEARAELEKSAAKVSEFTAKHNINTFDASALRSDAESYGRLKREDEAEDAKLAAFVSEHGVPERVTLAEAPDADALRESERELTAQVSALSADILSLKRKIAALDEEADALPELCDELERVREGRDADMKSAEILDRTIELLQSAKDSLSSRFMEPVRRAFDKYAAVLTGEDPGKIFVTPDFEVSVERSGERRELKYFSAGQADAVRLCMRFALIDALFTREKPFIILDDPFVNLDDESVGTCLSFVRELSQEYQLVYLTCHTSRGFTE